MHPAGIGRRHAPERRDQMGADIRVGVLLNDQGRRGVSEIKQHRAVARLDGVEEARNLARDLEKSFAGGLDRERRAVATVSARIV
jgi:hypothetical protein